ncbi:AraC family transcriptional regulator [Vagococcus sp. WN89Y]|uniref:AraC family transcriptional regulator n=1 Tax=Vagococcus sp. WN89Y TaxID=3457258 RepID=UPI003FCCF6F4
MLIVQSQTLSHQSKHHTPWHQHATGQLFAIRRGMMIVQTERAQWALTPATIGWFPAGLRHCAWTVGETEGCSVQLSQADVLPTGAGVWPADPFLMLLMERVSNIDLTHTQLSRQQHLLAVIADEIRLAPVAPLQLLLPTDRRARQVAEQLLLAPERNQQQAALASHCGLSVRTLRRLFSEQTGLSFSQWRQQARILASMGWLLQGETVSEAAAKCGYDNVSAFIAAFKLRFGMTPGTFRLNNAHESRPEHALR